MSEIEPTTFHEAARVVERLRTHVLLCSALGDGAPPKAEQHYLQALAYMDLAVRALRLASLEAEEP